MSTIHRNERAIIARFDRPWTFFIVAAIGPWTAWLIAARYSRQPLPDRTSLLLVSLFAGIGLALPMLVAWMLIRRDDVLRQDLRRRLSLHGLAWPNILLGAGIMLGSIWLAQLISLALGYSADQFRLARSASFSAGILIGWVPLLLAPVVEEISWHGYGTDALRRGLNLFWTSIVFSIYWALWHVPLAFIEGYYQANLVETGSLHTINFIVSLIPFVLLMNWLYYRSGRSIWVAVAFHLAANVSNEAFQTHPDSKIIQTGLLVALSLALILRDPAFFFGRDPDIAPEPRKVLR